MNKDMVREEYLTLAVCMGWLGAFFYILSTL